MNTMEQDFTPRDDRPDRRRSRVRRVRVRSGVSTKILIMLAVVAAVIFGIAVFFRVNTVAVRGNSIYDAATVRDASGIKDGDSLLTLNRAAVAARVEVALPYVEDVRIALSLPDKVILEITESEIVYSVLADSGQYWLMNRFGKMIEPVTEEAAALYPSVTGITVAQPLAGQAAASPQQENLEAALKVIASLDGSGLMDKIVRIDAAKTYDVSLWYGQQYEIRFGTATDLEHKVRFLNVVLDKLMDYQTGVIDLTLEEEDEARFTPW